MLNLQEQMQINMISWTISTARYNIEGGHRMNDEIQLDAISAKDL